MTTANSVGWDIGKLRLPIPTTPALTSARPLDPAADILFGLFEACINAEIGEHWSTITTSTPLAGSTPVYGRFRELPDLDAMRQVKTVWPMLAVYVEETPQTIQEVTLDEKYLVTRWGVDWVLGTLEAADWIKLSAAIRVVGKACVAVVEEGGHKAYSSYVSNGYTLARPVFTDCGFDSVRVVDFKSGGARFSESGPKYYAMSLTLETAELIKIGERGGDFTGATLKLSTGGGDGIAPDIAIADTSIVTPEG